MRMLNNVKTTVLLSSLMGLCMMIGYFMLGPYGMLFGLLFGGMGSIISFFYSDKIAMAAMRGREIGRGDLPWLFEMVERLASRAGLPMPRVYVCPQEAPNAFATGRNPAHAAVAITEGMLRFPRQEIEGVMAHELAHIRHRDVLISTVAAVMAGVISYAGYMLFFFGGRGRSNPLGMIGTVLMMLLAPIAAMVIRAAISRSREYVADHYAGELTGNPLGLASALQRLGQANKQVPTETSPAFHNLYIVEPLAASGPSSLFGSHPPVEKRVAALQQQASSIG